MKTLLVAIGITAGFVASLSAQVGSGPNERRSDTGPYQTGPSVGRDQSMKQGRHTQTPARTLRLLFYWLHGDRLGYPGSDPQLQRLQPTYWCLQRVRRLYRLGRQRRQHRGRWHFVDEA